MVAPEGIEPIDIRIRNPEPRSTGGAMRFHKGSCRKKMANICNCIVDDDGMDFYQCCGWYHKGCKGRIIDQRKRKKWSAQWAERPA